MKNSTMDTARLRKASVAVFLATEEKVAQDLCNMLKWAADEIDHLHAEQTAERREGNDPCKT